MTETLLKKVNTWADEKLILRPGNTVVVGVSGGADSICLLHLLCRLKKTREFRIVAVHINHMLRDEESMADESFVQSLCREWEIPLQVFREDVKGWSKTKGCSIEEAGRELRYKRLHRVRVETAAQCIALAHHSRDQAETVFLNLMRGSGLDGLCGMKDVQGYLIRPFLTVDKKEIEEYIHANELTFRLDSSNLDNTYIRNAIRNDIFPEIQQKTGFPPNTSLLRTVNLLRLDQDYLNQMALIGYHSVLLMEEEEAVTLKRKEFNHLHPAVAGRVIRAAWEKVTGSIKGLEAKHVEAIFALAKKEGRTRGIQLSCSVRAVIEYNRLRITKQKKHEAKPWSIPVQAFSTLFLPDRNIRVITRLYSRKEYEKAFGEVQKAKENSLIQLFDYDRINRGINIRSRLSGDVFFPYNSPGTKKLKDFFIDEKLPGSDREDILLLAEEMNILWVIGCRTADQYKITDSTGTILYVEIQTAD